MRLSQRLSRLSQTPGKSRAADMRDRLSRPYVNRAGKSLSLGWETLPPLKGAGRVEKAENLRPFYQDAAKGRQKDHGGTAPGKSLVVKLPQVKAREAAGNAYTPLRLSSVRSMPPTRYRASWTHGDGIGMGLVGTENKKSYLAAVLSPCWFLEAASL